MTSFFSTIDSHLTAVDIFNDDDDDDDDDNNDDDDGFISR